MLTKKTAILITTISFFCWACTMQRNLSPQQKLPRIENVHFTQQSDTVNVYYDLLAKSPDDRFDIKLMLSLGEDKMYQIDSTSTSGAVGKGVLPGKKKKISWTALEDFPQGIQGKQIQFIVNADMISSKKNNTWIYIGSGALLLGAGAVVGYLLLNSGEAGLPSPPTRPAINR